MSTLGIYMWFLVINCIQLVKKSRGLIVSHSWLVYFLNSFILMIISPCCSFRIFLPAIWIPSFPLGYFTFLVVYWILVCSLVGIISQWFSFCSLRYIYLHIPCIPKLFWVDCHCIKLWKNIYPIMKSRPNSVSKGI